jgi:uncharacterized protein (DUF1800 family)
MNDSAANDTPRREPWAAYEPTDGAPWNFVRASHLHRRAGFSATWGEIERDLADGPELSVTRLLKGSARADGRRDDFAAMADVIGDAAVASGDANRLKAWWLFRMLFSPEPLREKLALVWHNHFATSNVKVRDLGLMRRQNELFRAHGMGKFGELLKAVVKDPAMLVWLDADSNRKGKPNENLARELMELFTLGTGNRGRDSLGNYTEEDVKEAARALTGWTVVRGEFQFREDRHDDGEKTILGQSAKFDGDGLLDLLLGQRATARRIAWRLCSCFMGEDVVSGAALEELAAGLEDHDLDVGWAVETILRSELFFSDSNIGSRVKGPAEFVISAVRALELFDRPPSTLILAEWCTRCGADLFYPPNVGGWNEGRAWLSSRTIVARSNFAAALATGQLRAPTDPPDLCELAARHGAGTSIEEMCGHFEGLLIGSELPATDRDRIVAAAGQMQDGESRLRIVVSHILSHPQAQLG